MGYYTGFHPLSLLFHAVLPTQASGNEYTSTYFTTCPIWHSTVYLFRVKLLSLTVNDIPVILAHQICFPVFSTHFPCLSLVFVSPLPNSDFLLSTPRLSFPLTQFKSHSLTLSQYFARLSLTSCPSPSYSFPSSPPDSAPNLSLPFKSPPSPLSHS